MRLDTNSKFFLIFFTFLFGAAISNSLRRNSQSKDLKLNHIMVEGRIVFPSLGYPVWGRFSNIKFRYSYNEKNYEKKLSKSNFCKQWGEETRYEIAQLKFPVVLKKYNPKIARMVLKEKDYKYYDLEIPDSLKCTILNYFDCADYSEEEFEYRLGKCSNIE